MSNSNALSAAETAVYDRQLRVWGAEAQGRLKSSRVLVAGAGALGAEVAKNLALAGVAVTLADGAAVTLADVGSSYLLGADDVGANVRAAIPPLSRAGPRRAAPRGWAAARAGVRASLTRAAPLPQRCSAPPRRSRACVS